ncbi:MAG: (4Fe-4S)-binding protein, partial [Rikenellaceae bacterium]
MVNFGYKSASSRMIDLDKGDFRLSVELFKEDELLRACIGCGGCSGACTAAAPTAFTFRTLHPLIRRGA